MKFFSTALALGAICLAAPAHAQFEDEIIVTGTRIANYGSAAESPIPGTFLKVQGDFLIVTMNVYNDSRDIETRGKEIVATLENVARAARTSRDVELSLRVDGQFVRPFSLEAAIDAIRGGNLPETSQVSLLAKTPIPETVTNSYKLVGTLQDFADSIDTVGRSSVTVAGEPDVSVTNPDQYRGPLLELVADEIKAFTAALGGNYRAVVTDIDERMRFTRGGDLSLIFYIPYDYEILPTAITSRDQLIVSDDY